MLFVRVVRQQFPHVLVQFRLVLPLPLCPYDLLRGVLPVGQAVVDLLDPVRYQVGMAVVVVVIVLVVHLVVAALLLVVPELLLGVVVSVQSLLQGVVVAALVPEVLLLVLIIGWSSELLLEFRYRAAVGNRRAV